MLIIICICITMAAYNMDFVQSIMHCCSICVHIHIYIYIYIYVINTDWLFGCEEISLNEQPRLEGETVRGRCSTKTRTIRRLELSRKYANARHKPAVFWCV